MSNLKTITLIFLGFLPIYSSLASNSPALIFNTMNDCYENKNMLGVNLAKCMISSLKNAKNPNHYRVSIIDENPSKEVASHFEITIYNPEGLVTRCHGIAKLKIHIEKCVGKKITPLSPGEQMSITPPI